MYLSQIHVYNHSNEALQKCTICHFFIHPEKSQLSESKMMFLLRLSIFTFCSIASAFDFGSISYTNHFGILGQNATFDCKLDQSRKPHFHGQRKRKKN